MVFTLFTFNIANVNAEEGNWEWKTVYNQSWANGGLGYHPNGQVVTYYDGSLSGANEEIYRVTFKGKIYRNVDGFNFRLKDSDTTQVLFSRNESSYNFDGSHSYTTANNPDNLEIVMLVDFSKATPTADIDFYINGASTPFYTKSATLNDIDSIKKIDVYVWSSGNLDYSAPARPSLKIERKVIGHWEEKYATTGNPDLNGQFYYYLQNGGFSGSNSEKYRITFTAGHYTNISGGELFVGDSDSTSRVFFKSDYSNRFENDDNLNFPNDSNPCYVTVQAVVDFSTNPPTADVYFYEKDNDTPFGSKTVTLTDIDSIQSISWKVWDVGNIFYTTPKNPVLTIEEFVEGIEEPEQIEEDNIIWKTVYDWTSETDRFYTAGEQDIPDYFNGKLSGANGEAYHIKFSTKLYQSGGVDGFGFRICDYDTTSEIFYRTSNKTELDGKYTYQGVTNPDSITVDMLIDFAKTPPTADVSYYSNGSVEPFGTKTMELRGLEEIDRIYVYLWSTGNMSYSAPFKPSLKIDKRVIGRWVNKYSTNEGVDRDNAHTYIDYLQGKSLPCTNGEKYRITYTAGYQTGTPGGRFYIADSDTSNKTFFKSNYKEHSKNEFNNVSEFPNDDNPCRVTVKMLIDFSQESPVALVNLFSEGSSTPFAEEKSYSMSGLTSIDSIYWNNWDAGYYKSAIPKDPVLTIERFVEASSIELLGATIENNKVNVNMNIDNTGDDPITYAIIATYHNGENLVLTQYATGTVLTDGVKENHTFDIPAAKQGAFDKVTVFLWKDLNSIRPYNFGSVEAVR